MCVCVASASCESTIHVAHVCITSNNAFWVYNGVTQFVNNGTSGDGNIVGIFLPGPDYNISIVYFKQFPTIPYTIECNKKELISGMCFFKVNFLTVMSIIFRCIQYDY